MNPIRLNRNEDITVYKIMRQDENGNLHSLYYNYEWPVGEVQAINDKADIREHRYMGFNHTSVNGNAFHSFMDKEQAKDYAIEQFARLFAGTKYVLAECVIPADSKFVYLGAFNYSDDSYASEKLKVVSYEPIEFPEDSGHKQIIYF